MTQTHSNPPTKRSIDSVIIDYLFEVEEAEKRVAESLRADWRV